MKKVVIKVIIACLVVVGVGTGGYYGYKKYKSTKATTATTAQYITMRATKRNLDSSIQATGAVFAGTSKDIVASSAGTLKDLNVNIGDTVTADSVLFSIANDTLQQAIDKAQNTLDKQKLALSTAKAALVTANETLAAAKTAEANGTTATTSTNGQTKTVTVADAQASVASAKLNVSTAELAVKDAERDLTAAKDAKNAATVKSPINGMIITKAKNTGDLAQANASILTVIDPQSFKIKVAVDELDIQKVKVGQKASIALGAITDKTYEGTVEQIALTGTTSNNVTTYDVTLGIANPENIKIGMNGTVTISIESKQNVLAIPTDALIERNGKKYVMVPSDSAAQGATSSQTSPAPQANTGTQGNSQPQAGSQTSQNTNSQTSQDGQTKPNRQNGQTGQTNQTGQGKQNAAAAGTTSGANAAANTTAANGKLVEIKVGLVTKTYVEVLEGISEGQTLLVTLPTTTTTTTNTNRNSMGGFTGGAGTGGAVPQMPTGGGKQNN
jgi:HlyD family secretion protein